MSEYTAISKNAIIEDTEIGFNLYLRNGSNVNYKYVLFTRGNEQISSKRREQLLNDNSYTLYISTEDTDKYVKYREKNLNDIINDENKSTHEKSGVLYQVAENIVQDLLDDPKSGENMIRSSKWVNSTVTHIIKDENAFSSLFEVAAHDYTTYTHSVNTSVIGLLFGKYLSLTQHELDCLGIGLLLHDIGKTSIPPNVINRAGKISVSEFENIKKHPKAGFELLAHRNYIDGTSLKVVIQHHENQDGTGYPYGIGGKDIHLFGSISRIVDVYDAMTSNRSYSKAKRPFAVLAEMKDSMPGCFNEELLREFICFLGPNEERTNIRADDKLYSTLPANN